MLAFLESPRFPERIAHGATGGPAFRTSIVELASGHEQRNVDWSAARGRWNVASGLKDRGYVSELLSFFRVVRGRAVGFRFKDFADFQAVDQTLGIGDGSETNFPLVKHYAAGAESVAREIAKPVPGSLTVFIEGVEQGSGWSLDEAHGILTLDAPPGSGARVSADFSFDVPVRFDTDEMVLDLATEDFSEWSDIPLVEIRP